MQITRKFMAILGLVVVVYGVWFVSAPCLYGAGLSEQEKFLKTLEAIMQKSAFDPDKDAAILKSFIQDSGASVASLFSQVDAQDLFNIFDTATTIKFVDHGTESNFMAWLLDNDPIFKDINVKQQVTGKTLLIYAVEFNKINLIKLLLSRNDINVNAKNNEGRVALHYAAMLGQQDSVKLLLNNKGIDINAQDNHGRTVLFSIYKEHGDLMKLLLESGANPFIKDNDGKTALDSAQENNFPVIVDLLKQAEARAKKESLLGLDQLKNVLMALKTKLSQLAGKLQGMMK
ncbi:ankyrin repeat domain-containing protein [bacterium]|nr:MAG: ankyrin repeat domain-containing protein [bacterium]